MENKTPVLPKKLSDNSRVRTFLIKRCASQRLLSTKKRCEKILSFKKKYEQTHFPLIFVLVFETDLLRFIV
jgi:hypothetical protein